MNTHRPRLQIHLLFHPRSTAARELAQAMFTELASSPMFPGPRIPVLYACDDGTDKPPPIDTLRTEDAEYTLVCLLADERMARTAAGGRGRAWGTFADLVVSRCARRPRTAVVPVAVDGGAFHLHPRLARTSFVRLDAKGSRELQSSELFFQLAVRSLELLAHEAAGAPSTAAVAPLQVFVSHAKANLPRDQEGYEQARGAVLSLLDYLAQGPVRAWFDSSQIRPGQRFDRAIARGVGGSTAFIAVHTDDYSRREWCRREYLRARELDLPIVVVDAIADQDPVAFPYFGSVPRLRWSERSEGLSMPRRVVHVLLQEALRHAVLSRRARGGQPTTARLSRQPDVLSMQLLPPRTKVVVYPDPPLSPELRALLHGQRPKVHFTTPMLEAAGSLQSLRGHHVGLSLAQASDSHRLGQGDEHLKLLVDDLSLLLLLGGAEVGYGGWYGVKGPDYTAALLDRARTLAALADGRPGTAPVTHFVSWPKHLDASDDELRLYERSAKLVRCPEPSGLALRERLAEDTSGFFRRLPPEGANWPEDLRAARQFAHGRGLSVMRQRMNGWLTARLCVGGKLSAYAGLLPGIVEEVLLAMRKRKPVFLLAAFGGATEMISDVLAGRTRTELTSAHAATAVHCHGELVSMHKQYGPKPIAPEEAAQELESFGFRGLNNGLSRGENDELLDCTDPFRIAALVAKGLTRCPRPGRGARKS